MLPAPAALIVGCTPSVLGWPAWTPLTPTPPAGTTLFSPPLAMNRHHAHTRTLHTHTHCTHTRAHAHTHTHNINLLTHVYSRSQLLHTVGDKRIIYYKTKPSSSWPHEIDMHEVVEYDQPWLNIVQAPLIRVTQKQSSNGTEKRLRPNKKHTLWFCHYETTCC